MSSDERTGTTDETPEKGHTEAPLEGLVTPSDPQCEAIAASTGERCQREAMYPFPYCGTHSHLLDDVDKERMGLRPPKSGG